MWWKPAVNGNKYVDQAKELVKDEDAEVIILSREQRLISQNWKLWRASGFFLEDIWIDSEPWSLSVLIVAYTIKANVFFTAGVKEVLGPSILIYCAQRSRSNSHRPRKRIHPCWGDSYEDYAYGSEAKAKEEAGKFKVEVKEYIVKR
jgi:hypothetical protein